MTDRELLEAAAKTIGLNLWWAMDDPSCNFVQERPAIPNSSEPDKINWRVWDPLMDDGDAFRLAVKLNLHVEIDAESSGVITIEWDFDEAGTARKSVEQEAPIDGDDYAATRRAIVRAAALTSQEPHR